jgi:hypothetical protein
MALGAIVSTIPLEPGFRRKAAAPIGMTLQTAMPVIGCFHRGSGKVMRIVARNTAELTLASLEASTLAHLFKLADETALCLLRRLDKHSPELLQRQPRPVVLLLPKSPQNPLVAYEMALRADGIPKSGREISRVNDRKVLTAFDRRRRDVELARSVAAFTTDRVTLKDRRPILVDWTCDKLNPISVAEQTAGSDRPVEMVVVHFKSRREVPLLLLAEPGQGGLKEEAVACAQKGNSLPA